MAPHVAETGRIKPILGNHCTALRITSNKLASSKQFKTKTKNSLRSPSCLFISDNKLLLF